MNLINMKMINTSRLYVLPSFMCHWQEKGDSVHLSARTDRVAGTRVSSAYNPPRYPNLA